MAIIFLYHKKNHLRQMQRQLVNDRKGITTGEAVELAREARGLVITTQTVRNLIASGFLQNLSPDGGWYQIDSQEFLNLLDRWLTSGGIAMKLHPGPYHLKRQRRDVPTNVSIVPLNRGLDYEHY